MPNTLFHVRPLYTKRRESSLGSAPHSQFLSSPLDLGPFSLVSLLCCTGQSLAPNHCLAGLRAGNTNAAESIVQGGWYGEWSLGPSAQCLDDKTSSPWVANKYSRFKACHHHRTVHADHGFSTCHGHALTKSLSRTSPNAKCRNAIRTTRMPGRWRIRSRAHRHCVRPWHTGRPAKDLDSARSAA